MKSGQYMSIILTFCLSTFWTPTKIAKPPDDASSQAGTFLFCFVLLV
jgi:hypothetical protein